MTDEQELRLRYTGGQANIEDLEQEVSTILEELAKPGSDAFEDAVAAGLEPDDLVHACINIEMEAKGFGTVALLIAIFVPFGAAVGAHIVNKFWDDIIEPRIVDQLGRKALGKRDAKEGGDKNESDE